MMSVKKAEMNTRTIVTVIINVVGWPFSKLPVRRASQRNAHFTGKRRKIVNPTAVSRTQRAVRPLPAFTNATVRARRIQPTT